MTSHSFMAFLLCTKLFLNIQFAASETQTQKKENNPQKFNLYNVHYLWGVTNLNCQQTNKMFIHILNTRCHQAQHAYISLLILILLKYYCRRFFFISYCTQLLFMIVRTMQIVHAFPFVRSVDVLLSSIKHYTYAKPSSCQMSPWKHQTFPIKKHRQHFFFIL